MQKPWEEKKAWKAARKLTGSVYRMTEARDFEEDVDLRRQVRRATASMLAEIAQLYESPGRPDMLRSLRDARSSVTRLQSQLSVAADRYYIEPETFDELNESAQELKESIAEYFQDRS
jgi:four helix bundle protein